MCRSAENGPHPVPKPSHNPHHDPAPESERRQIRPKGRELETVPKRIRRTFGAADKLRIVQEADACLASGERGAVEALLRREGIYSSLLSSWRSQLAAQGTAGLASKRPGRKPRLTEAERRIGDLAKRNAILEKKLRIANALLALQKKAQEVLGIALPESDGDI